MCLNAGRRNLPNNKQNKNMTTEIDPLNETIGDIDTSFPRLVPSNYPMSIECKIEPNKAGTGNNLIVTHKTTQEALSTSGDKMPAGVTITRYIGLTESAPKPGKSKGRDMKAINADVAVLAKAAKLPLTTKVSDLKADPTPLNGKVVIAKVSIRQATAEFPESNDVKGYVIEG